MANRTRTDDYRWACNCNKDVIMLITKQIQTHAKKSHTTVKQFTKRAQNRKTNLIKTENFRGGEMMVMKRRKFKIIRWKSSLEFGSLETKINPKWVPLCQKIKKCLKTDSRNIFLFENTFWVSEITTGLMDRNQNVMWTFFYKNGAIFTILNLLFKFIKLKIMTVK